MSDFNNDFRANVAEALEELSMLMSIAYEQLGLVPEDHALARAGLQNGGGIALDHVDRNEAIAEFEHLPYMVNEQPLVASEKCIEVSARFSTSLNIPFTM